MYRDHGINFKLCRCGSREFINKNYETEGSQLLLFGEFVLSNIDGLLRDQQWARSAERYNGSGYKANRYDVKLKRFIIRIRSYIRHKSHP